MVEEWVPWKETYVAFITYQSYIENQTLPLVFELLPQLLSKSFWIFHYNGWYCSPSCLNISSFSLMTTWTSCSVSPTITKMSYLLLWRAPLVCYAPHLHGTSPNKNTHIKTLSYVTEGPQCIEKSWILNPHHNGNKYNSIFGSITYKVINFYEDISFFSTYPEDGFCNQGL